MGSFRFTLSIFWRFSKAYPSGLFKSLFIVFGNALSNILSPLIVVKIVDNLLNGKTIRESYVLFIYLALSSGFGLVIDGIGRKALYEYEHKAALDMDKYIFGHILGAPYDFHVNNFSGGILSKIQKFEQSYWTLNDTLFGATLVFVVNTTLSIIILMRYNITVGLIFAGLTALFGIFSIRLARQRTPLRNAANRIGSVRTGLLADVLSNAVTAKTFSKERLEIKSLLKVTREWFDASIIVNYKALDNGALNIALGSIIQITTLAAAFIAVSRDQLAVSAVILIFAYTSRLVDSMFKLSDTVKNIEKAMADSKEISDILATDHSIKDVDGAMDIKTNGTGIDFKHVAFSYEEGSDSLLLDGLDLHIDGGTSVGLVGPSGGGKTTITKLLLRFMDIRDGEILIDGQDISKVTQTSLRDAITYVPQEPLLFHRSLAENIRYGRPSATMKQVIDAAKKANADEFIAKLPKKYDTLVGERGIKLSGGQRQRIAIARAILKDAPIVVLDEATSALDSESEKLIQEALFTLMKDRTSIVIAHRLSTIKHLDRILILEDGAITEDGTHDELIKKKSGTYARLWSHQSGGFIE